MCRMSEGEVDLEKVVDLARRRRWMGLRERERKREASEA